MPTLPSSIDLSSFPQWWRNVQHHHQRDKRFVFQASITGAFSNTPDNYNVKDITDGTRRYKATSRDNEKSWSPVLDLYFFRQLTSHQSITANAVGTYISTQSSSYYDEGSPYQYDVKGKTASRLIWMVTTSCAWNPIWRITSEQMRIIFSIRKSTKRR